MTITDEDGYFALCNFILEDQAKHAGGKLWFDELC